MVQDTVGSKTLGYGFMVISAGVPSFVFAGISRLSYSNFLASTVDVHVCRHQRMYVCVYVFEHVCVYVTPCTEIHIRMYAHRHQHTCMYM